MEFASSLIFQFLDPVASSTGFPIPFQQIVEYVEPHLPTR
jgi:hypothetical protein